MYIRRVLDREMVDVVKPAAFGDRASAERAAREVFDDPDFLWAADRVQLINGRGEIVLDIFREA
ncbi:MAG: hypothetical protein WC992_03075 [Acholeplasmataceae bacterium]|jgi:hypothetical protein